MIFVTGGSGFIGRRVVARLREAGLMVTAPARAQLDLLDTVATAAAIAEAAPSTIIHLASAGVFATGVADAAIVEGEIQLARNIAAALQPGMRLIQAGSMAEYGQSGRHREDMVCTPRTAYARGKYEAGRHAQAAAAERGAEYCHVRIYGAYGPGEAASRLLPAVVDALVDNRPVALSDGLQRRDFVHVDDIAEGMFRLLRHTGPLPDCVNIGTGRAVEIRSMLLHVAHVLNRDPALLLFGSRARAINDEDLLEADTARLKTMLGWIPPQRIMDLHAAAFTELVTA